MMNKILKTTKWAVIVTSKDGEELQKLFPKDRACGGDLKWLVKVGFESYKDLAVSPCYSGVYDGSDWHYSPIRFYQEAENCTVYTLEELKQLMTPKLKSKEELPFKEFAVLHDGSTEFREFREWFNTQYNDWWVGDAEGNYYGYQKYNAVKPKSAWENVKLYTAKEFMELLKEDEVLYLEPNTYTTFDKDKAKELFELAKKNNLVGIFSYLGWEHILFVESDGNVNAYANDYSAAEKGQEISPEEFETRLLNTIQKLKPMEKKIIGYKAPFDIMVEAPKGTVYVEHGGKYCPKGKEGHGTGWYLPKPIVELWEPVYEEQYKVGDYVTVVNPDPDFEGRFKVGDVYKVWNIGKYNSKHALELVDSMYAVYFTEVRLSTQAEIDSIKEQVVSMGSFNLKITPNGIFHKSENITKFCEETFQFHSNLPTTFSSYDAKIKDIVFLKTGCEKSETKLSQWVEVYQKYIAIKRKSQNKTVSLLHK